MLIFFLLLYSMTEKKRILGNFNVKLMKNNV